MSPLRRFARLTRPDPAAVERVKDRLDAELDPADLRALLREAPGPAPGAAARVRARLDASAPRPLAWRLPALGLTLAAAAAAAAAVSWPLPPPPHDLTLGETPTMQLDGLRLDVDGGGALTGPRRAPEVRWDEGRLAVDADADVAPVVRTREAEITGPGAAFAVTRDRLGTRVDPRRASVSVRCLIDGDEHTPTAALTCLPVSAEGMLGRAQALAESGAPGAEVLAAAEAGLALPAATPVTLATLTLLRVQRLAALERADEGLAVARAWLGDHPHDEPVQRAAAGLALATEGCEGARPLLIALADSWPQAAQRLAACDTLTRSAP